MICQPFASGDFLSRGIESSVNITGNKCLLSSFSQSLFFSTKYSFFQQTDLCGLKWRKYVFHLACLANPVDDPVLKSFSSALSHDILCAWRRSPSTGCPANSDPDSINSANELWVFWFGDDPNLQGIVSAELKGKRTPFI